MPLTISIRQVDVDTTGEDLTRDAHLVAPARCEILRAFALLPDEAFMLMCLVIADINSDAVKLLPEAREALQALQKSVSDHFAAYRREKKAEFEQQLPSAG